MSLSVRPNDQFITDIDSSDDDNINVRPRRVSRDATNMDAIRDAQARADNAASRLPAWLKFPLAAFATLSLSTILHSITADYTGPELASVSRVFTAEWQIALMTAYKLAELAAAWYLGYDYADLAWLTFLSNVPHYFLLNTFYGVDYFAALIPLVIDVTAIAVPFALLRGMTHARDKSSPKTPNQVVAQDVGIQWLTGLFGAAIYTFVVYGSFYTWLPAYMVVHFDGLKSVAKAHDSALLLLFALFGPVGYAATQFIFVPAVGSAGNPGITDPKLKPELAPFDPETASLGQTIAYNIGLKQSGFTRRAEILTKRTVTLVACSFLNTFFRSFVTIEGTELVGALGWASVWATGAALVGAALSWVGDE